VVSFWRNLYSAHPKKEIRKNATFPASLKDKSKPIKILKGPSHQIRTRGRYWGGEMQIRRKIGSILTAI
jgi:hypothetical protein